jgi:hypothetical protein
VLQTHRSASRLRRRQIASTVPSLTGRRKLALLLIPAAVRPSFHTAYAVATDARVSPTAE